MEKNSFKCEGYNLDEGIRLSGVGIYAQNLQFTAGFLVEDCYGGGDGWLKTDSAPADWVKGPAGFVCV